jgi:hypothetical protein
MRKVLVPLALVAMMFASCKKYEASEALNLKSLPTVTLTGTVYANLDETTPTLEFAPAGTIVRVSVPYSDYDLNNTSGGNWISDPFTLGSDGQFTIAVPVVSSGVKATLSFSDFTYKVKQQNGVLQDETILKHFHCGDITKSNLGAASAEGDRIKIDAQYASTTVDPNGDVVLTPSKTVTVSGKLEYQKSDTSLAVVPEGTTIIAQITLTAPDAREYKVTKSVTVGVAGTYSIAVPMVAWGEASIKLSGEAFWEYTTVATGKRALYRYVLSTTVGGIYNVDIQPDKDETYTKGVKIKDID